MPGRYEKTGSTYPERLNGAACKATSAALEPVCSRGHAIALLVVLVSACVLLLTPAVVAAISMIDPSALDQTLSWFQPLSPIASHLDHLKLVLATGSVAMVWSGWQGSHVRAAVT
jgi:hypothetical protein